MNMDSVQVVERADSTPPEQRGLIAARQVIDLGLHSQAGTVSVYTECRCRPLIAWWLLGLGWLVCGWLAYWSIRTWDWQADSQTVLHSRLKKCKISGASPHTEIACLLCAGIYSYG